AAVCRSDRGDAALGADRAAGAGHVLGIGGRHACVVNDAGLRRVQRGDPGGVRLDLAELVRVQPAQARYAVGGSPALELLQPQKLAGVGGDDQLAATLGRDAALVAVVVQLPGALHAQPRLQRAGRVVDALVDDAGVVPGL